MLARDASHTLLARGVGGSNGSAFCRSRHLMLDLAQLLPHCKRDSKLDTKTDRGVINEVADMKVGHGALAAHQTTLELRVLLMLQGCSSVLFFESRKRKDLYIWLARAPDGPSIKFHCANGELSHLLP